QVVALLLERHHGPSTREKVREITSEVDATLKANSPAPPPWLIIVDQPDTFDVREYAATADGSRTLYNTGSAVILLDGSGKVLGSIGDYKSPEAANVSIRSMHLDEPAGAAYALVEHHDA